MDALSVVTSIAAVFTSIVTAVIAVAAFYLSYQQRREAYRQHVFSAQSEAYSAALRKAYAVIQQATFLYHLPPVERAESLGPLIIEYQQARETALMYAPDYLAQAFFLFDMVQAQIVFEMPAGATPGELPPHVQEFIDRIIAQSAPNDSGPRAFALYQAYWEIALAARRALGLPGLSRDLHKSLSGGAVPPLFGPSATKQRR